MPITIQELEQLGRKVKTKEDAQAALGRIDTEGLNVGNNLREHADSIIAIIRSKAGGNLPWAPTKPGGSYV